MSGCIYPLRLTVLTVNNTGGVSAQIQDWLVQSTWILWLSLFTTWDLFRQKSMPYQVRESSSQSNLHSSYSESVMYKYNVCCAKPLWLGLFFYTAVLTGTQHYLSLIPFSFFDHYVVSREDAWQLHTYSCCFWFCCHHC